MFSAEDDWEDIIADNDSSGACLEVLDKFMDEYKTHFDANGKLLQGFTLFDQESIPYDDLLQAVRSSKCKDHKNEARTTKLARKEVPSKKAYKAKAKPTTATMNVYQSKAPSWTRSRKVPHKRSTKVAATVPKAPRKKEQSTDEASDSIKIQVGD
jgi:hypothetical protein